MQTHFDVPGVPTVDRAAFLLGYCHGKRTLHLGCTDWPLTEERFLEGSLLHQKIKASRCDVVGLDLDAQGVGFLNDHDLGPCLTGNVESVTLDDLGGAAFDVILAGEIIEHLENPGRFLRACKTLLAPEGLLIVTTVNAYCLFRIVRYLFGRELVHEDHNYYFSPRVLQKLLTRCGFDIVQFRFHGTGRETHKIPFHYRLCSRITAMMLPRMADGVLAVARNRNS